MGSGSGSRRWGVSSVSAGWLHPAFDHPARTKNGASDISCVGSPPRENVTVSRNESLVFFSEEFSEKILSLWQHQTLDPAGGKATFPVCESTVGRICPSSISSLAPVNLLGAWREAQ
ncbi:hypothetical protein H1C71_029702 [Ictidomys tridecemlineatus]|nr:hypothetical protein H1C71_029702 [Ictidomys tridecemlineatus]